MKKHLLVFTMAFLVWGAASAFADREALPSDYKVTTPDGRYVFVMLGGETEIFQNKTLRRQYPVSGLYQNDASSTLVWKLERTPEWVTSEKKIFLSSDTRHLAVLGPWPRGWGSDSRALQQPAVLFFEDGRLIKSYSIGDLVSESAKLPKSVSHFTWLKWGSVFFNDKARRLSLMTEENKKYVFDIVTGGIINS